MVGNALNANQVQSEELTQKGNQAFAVKKYFEAKAYYLQAVFKNPRNLNARYNLAQIMFYHTNEKEDALDHYKIFHELNQNKQLSYAYANRVRDYARQLVSEKEYEKAIEKFKLLPRAMPEVFSGRKNTLEICLDDLINCLNKYADQKIQRFLSDAEVVKSNNDKDVIFEKITDNLSYINESSYLRPLILRRALAQGNVLGDIMWEKRGTKEPSLERGSLKKISLRLQELVNSHFHQNTDNQRLAELIDNDPTNAMLYFYRGKQSFHSKYDNETLLKKIKYENALRDFRRYVMLMPADPSGYFNCASCLFELSKFDQALDYINLAINQDPMNREYYSFKINILKKLGMDKEAGLMKYVQDIAFDDRLKTDKNKKATIVDAILKLPSDDQLALFKMIMEKETALGILMWEKESPKDKPSLSSGWLKKIAGMVAVLDKSESGLDRLQVDETDVVETPKPNKFGLFGKSTASDNNNNNAEKEEKQQKQSGASRFALLFSRIALQFESQPENVKPDDMSGSIRMSYGNDENDQL